MKSNLFSTGLGLRSSWLESIITLYETGPWISNLTFWERLTSHPLLPTFPPPLRPTYFSLFSHLSDNLKSRLTSVTRTFLAPVLFICCSQSAARLNCGVLPCLSRSGLFGGGGGGVADILSRYGVYLGWGWRSPLVRVPLRTGNAFFASCPFVRELWVDSEPERLGRELGELDGSSKKKAKRSCGFVGKAWCKIVLIIYTRKETRNKSLLNQIHLNSTITG